MFNITDNWKTETINTGNKVRTAIEPGFRGFGWKGHQHTEKQMNRSTIGSIASRKENSQNVQNVTLLIG